MDMHACHSCGEQICDDEVICPFCDSPTELMDSDEEDDSAE